MPHFAALNAGYGYFVGAGFSLARDIIDPGGVWAPRMSRGCAPSGLRG